MLEGMEKVARYFSRRAKSGIKERAAEECNSDCSTRFQTHFC